VCRAANERLKIRAGVRHYRYNNKELNEDFGLDWYAYGARYYDPVLARFTGVDPISDQFPHVSTFNYAENEPIRNIDLHGLQALDHSAKFNQPNEDPFGTAGRQALISYARKAYTGKGKLGSLSEEERNEAFNSSVENTFAVLLYEFATGTGPDVTEFNEDHPITEEIKESFSTLEAVSAFYSAFNDYNQQDQFKQLDDGSIEFNYDAQMSPDRTETLKESIDKHVIGLVGLISGNPDRQIIQRGHINYKIRYNSNEPDVLNVKASDRYTAKSAFYRLSPNRNSGPLRSTTQTWSFTLPFSANRKK